MRTVRIATTSFLIDDTPTTVEQNRDRGSRYIKDAAERGCDLVVLPEMFTTVNTGAEIKPEPVVGPTLDIIRGVAVDCSINVAATYYVEEHGRVFNQTTVVSRTGVVAGVYRKVQPTAAEAGVVTAGDSLEPIELDFGRVGVMICLDIYFPEIPRIYAHRGVEVLLWPTVTLGPTQEGLLAQAQSRAIDNGLYVVESNMASRPPYAPYAGRIRPGTGRIIGPGGDILASTGRRAGLAVADIDLDEPRLTSTCIMIREPDHFREDLQSITRLDFFAREYADIARDHTIDRQYAKSIQRH